MSTSAGPNIVEDGLVLYLDAANEKSFSPYNNLLDTSTWTIGTGSVTGFSQNGSTEENHRIFDTDPWGNTNIVWEARPDAVSGADGGWGGSNFSVDQSKMYRFSIWVRRTVKGNGHFYLGTYGRNSSQSNIGVKRRSSTTTTTNPYFEVNSNWDEWTGNTSGGSTWYLVVAHVWPFGSGEGSNYSDSGIYKQDGTLVDTIEYDFVWIDGTFYSSLRTYLYYSTDTATRQQWIYPRVDVVDGTEPSIQDLLDNKPYVSYDLTGNANDGSLLNNVSFNDANNGSFVFDGVDDGIQLPGTNLSLNEMTISSWNFSSDYNQNGFMFEKTTDGSVNTQYSLFFNNSNNIYYRTYDLSARDLVLSNTSSWVVNNQWNNVVATWDGTNKKIYVNGILRATSANLTGTVRQNNTGAAYVGIYGNLAGYPFNGKISQTSVYNRALTAQEIKQNYDALRIRYGI